MGERKSDGRASASAATTKKKNGVVFSRRVLDLSLLFHFSTAAQERVS